MKHSTFKCEGRNAAEILGLTIIKHELVDEVDMGKKHTTAAISRKSKLFEKV